MRLGIFIVPVAFAICVMVAFSGIPLMDRTESRVAVISDRLLVENDLFHLKVPKNGEYVNYHAKPPLHYWTVAASIKALGRRELSVRLPSLIAATVALCLVPVFQRRRVRNAQLILATSLIFFFAAGLGIVDATLGLALGVCTLGLYRWIALERRGVSTLVLMLSGAVYACALKGPVGLAVPALSVIIFSVGMRSFAPIRDLPWKIGLAGLSALLVGYYGFVEYHNPGFCRYFFLNENLLRYLVENYGDRTGSGHTQPYGMSIVFAAVAFLPWSPFLAISMWRSRPYGKEESFLAAALLAPIVLFLFARQHLATYQIPMLLPASLLLGSRLRRDVVPPIAVSTIFVFTFIPFLGAGIARDHFSSAGIFEEAVDQGIQNVHFQYEAPLSAYWYSAHTVPFDTRAPLPEDPAPHDIFVARGKHRLQFAQNFGEVCSNNVAQRGKWTLFHCAPESH